jgi:hypothetical protein
MTRLLSTLSLWILIPVYRNYLKVIDVAGSSFYAGHLVASYLEVGRRLTLQKHSSLSRRVPVSCGTFNPRLSLIRLSVGIASGNRFVTGQVLWDLCRCQLKAALFWSASVSILIYKAVKEFNHHCSCILSLALWIRQL